MIITSHSRTHRFEATRRSSGPGPWCVISSDPADLWRELADRARPAVLDGAPSTAPCLMARLTFGTCPAERIPRPPDRIPRD